MRLRRHLVLVAVALGVASPVEAAGVFRKGPYLQQVTRTSAVVMFELAEAAPATLRVGPLQHADAGRPSWRTSASAEAILHEVAVSGLEPSRRYRYEVTVGASTASGEIATAPLPHEAFSFVVWGDTRVGDNHHRALCEALAIEAPDFLVHTGDIVSAGGNRGEWERFFDIEADLLRNMPVFPVVGNHDREGLLQRTERYRHYFSLPPHAPNPERYYSFTWGNSRFIALDSTEPRYSLADQTLWLEEQLAAAVTSPEVRHIFAVMHHPLFTTAIHGPHKEARLAWTPLFERYRVDVVFAGHEHVYEHLEKNGVRYVTTGGGGAPLYFQRPNPPVEDRASSVSFRSTYHFVQVHVAGDFVELAAMHATGEVIDSFSFGARPAGVCRTGSDCDGLLHPGCPGAWRCVSRACEWRCGAAQTTQAPPPPPPPPVAPPARRMTLGRAAWLGLLALGLAGAALLAWRRRRR